MVKESSPAGLSEEARRAIGVLEETTSCLLIFRLGLDRGAGLTVAAFRWIRLTRTNRKRGRDGPSGVEETWLIRSCLLAGSGMVSCSARSYNSTFFRSSSISARGTLTFSTGTG